MSVNMRLINGCCDFCESEDDSVFEIEGNIYTSAFGELYTYIWICKDCLGKVIKAEKKIDDSKLIDY